jgi:Aspartyl protease/PDZ domain
MRSTLAAFALALTCSTALAATPDEILSANRAASGGAALAHKAAMRQAFDYVGNGLSGKANQTTDLKDGRFEQDFDLGVVKGANGYDGKNVWNKDNSGIVTLQEGGDAVPLAVNAAYRNANLWWRPDHGGATITSDGQKTEGGVGYDVLTVVPKGGKTFDAWFDAKTHLLHRIDEAQANVMFATTFSNYRDFDGVPWPVDTLISSGDPKYDQHTTLTKSTFLKTSDAGAYAPPPSAGPDFSIPSGAHSVSFPFQLISNHIHAEVTINGKGPYLFIFDTGGVNIISPQMAQDLGAKVQGHAEGRGAGDATIDVGVTHVDKVDVGGAVVNDQNFMAYDLDAMYAANGTHMPGMIGYEVFRRFVTQIDYGSKTITLIDPKYFDPKDAGTAIPFKFNGNAVIVPGSYNGAAGEFQIDTGARSALTLDAPYADANHIGEGVKGVDAIDGWGVGGASRSHVIRGGVLKIGDAISIDGTIVGVGRDKKGSFADPTIAGNIGGGVLKRFVVTFDYGNKVLYLKPVAGTVEDLDAYDRFGGWFNVEGNGYKLIGVTPGGPAAQAGLKEGDVFTSIDGKPVVAGDLPWVRQRFRDDPAGTVVTLHMSGGQDVKVTLKDQI